MRQIALALNEVPIEARVHGALAARGRVVGGMNVNIWDVTEPVPALVRSRQPVDVAALTDPNMPLDTFVGGTTTGS